MVRLQWAHPLGATFVPHLLEFDPHEETSEPLLQRGHDLSGAFVPHVLEPGQDAPLEEHLAERHSDLRIVRLTNGRCFGVGVGVAVQKQRTIFQKGPSAFGDPGADV